MIKQPRHPMPSQSRLLKAHSCPRVAWPRVSTGTAWWVGCVAQPPGALAGGRSRARLSRWSAAVRRGGHAHGRLGGPLRSWSVGMTLPEPCLGGAGPPFWTGQASRWSTASPQRTAEATQQATASHQRNGRLSTAPRRLSRAGQDPCPSQAAGTARPHNRPAQDSGSRLVFDQFPSITPIRSRPCGWLCCVQGGRRPSAKPTRSALDTAWPTVTRMRRSE